ncbi:MAG: hypothetical protein PHG08_00125 [Bacilli bacterium]|nr:hypothetical protein [Bacilli bacterium]
MTTPANPNYLQPTGFLLSIEKLPGINFFAQTVNLPAMTGGVAYQGTPNIDAPLIGDKILFSDLEVTFLVDENLSNYEALFTWMQSVYHTESLDQYAAFHESEANRLIGSYNPQNHSVMYSDGFLSILTNNSNPNKTFAFTDLFPVQVSPLQFSTTVTDINYLQCKAVFKYTGFSF